MSWINRLLIQMTAFSVLFALVSPAAAFEPAVSSGQGNTGIGCELDLVIMLDVSPSMPYEEQNIAQYVALINYMHTYLQATHHALDHEIRWGLYTFSYDVSEVIAPSPIDEADLSDLIEEIEGQRERSTAEYMSNGERTPTATDFDLAFQEGYKLLFESLNKAGCWPVILMISDGRLESNPKGATATGYAERTLQETINSIQRGGARIEMVLVNSDELKQETGINEALSQFELWDEILSIAFEGDELSEDGEYNQSAAIHEVSELGDRFDTGFYPRIFESLLPPEMLDLEEMPDPLKRKEVRDGIDEYSYSIKNHLENVTLTFFLDDGLIIDSVYPEDEWDVEENDGVYTYQLVPDYALGNKIFTITGNGSYIVIEEDEAEHIRIRAGVRYLDREEVQIEALLERQIGNEWIPIKNGNLDLFASYETLQRTTPEPLKERVLNYDSGSGIYLLNDVSIGDEPGSIDPYLAGTDGVPVVISARSHLGFDIDPVTLSIYSLTNCDDYPPKLTVAPITPQPDEPITFAIQYPSIPDKCKINGVTLEIINKETGQIYKLQPKDPDNSTGADRKWVSQQPSGFPTVGEYEVSISYEVGYADSVLEKTKNDNKTTFSIRSQTPTLIHHSDTGILGQSVEGEGIKFYYVLRNIDGTNISSEGIVFEIFESESKDPTITFSPERDEMSGGGDIISISKEDASALKTGTFYEARIRIGSDIESISVPFRIMENTTQNEEKRQKGLGFGPWLDIFFIGLVLVAVILLLIMLWIHKGGVWERLTSLGSILWGDDTPQGSTNNPATANEALLGTIQEIDDSISHDIANNQTNNRQDRIREIDRKLLTPTPRLLDNTKVNDPARQKAVAVLYRALDTYSSDYFQELKEWSRSDTPSTREIVIQILHLMHPNDLGKVLEDVNKLAMNGGNSALLLQALSDTSKKTHPRQNYVFNYLKSWFSRN